VDQLFYPKSVVVIGVSEHPGNLARTIVENLFEFQFNGEIFLVGKREAVLFGRRIVLLLMPFRKGSMWLSSSHPAPTVPALLESCDGKRFAGPS